MHITLLRNLLTLSITSSVAASNDDSNNVVFTNVLMKFPELITQQRGGHYKYKYAGHGSGTNL